MTKTITVSDRVYRGLMREKGERSFSGVIEDALTCDGSLPEVTGQQMLAADTTAAVQDDVERMAEGTLDRLCDGPS